MWYPVARWWTWCRKCYRQSLPRGPFSEMALAWNPVSDPSRECGVILFDSLIHKRLLIFWWCTASLPSEYRLCYRVEKGRGLLEDQSDHVCRPLDLISVLHCCFIHASFSVFLFRKEMGVWLYYIWLLLCCSLGTSVTNNVTIIGAYTWLSEFIIGEWVSLY